MSRTLEVTKLHIGTSVQCRFATTTINSHVMNSSIETQETNFIAIIPNAAFIHYFEMEIDGKVIVGDVEEKEKANREYKAAKERGETAGHVEKVARKTNTFNISVNVAAKGTIRFQLIYQELLQRAHGVYKHQINISPQLPVTDLYVAVTINEGAPITTLHVPTFAARLSDKSTKDLLLMKQAEDVRITKETQSDYRIRWHPSIEEQKKYANKEEIIDGQLIVIYDVEHRDDQVLVFDGHFIHFFVPKKDLTVGTKNILFVLDTSESMRGGKLDQVKVAMRAILAQLHPSDRFGIICFNTAIKKKKSEMATAANVAEAIGFIDAQDARGGTDIDKAVQVAISLMKTELASVHQKHLANIVVLLTGGGHNSGRYTTDQIIPRVLKYYDPKIKIYGLAFGSGADFPLLRQLAAITEAFARKIYEDADADLQLMTFYDEISSPLLADNKIKYLSPAVDEATVVQDTDADTLYEGTEFVVVGKMNYEMGLKEGDRLFELAARSSQGQLKYGCRYTPWTPPENAIPGTAGGVIERSWAYLTVKALLKSAEVELEEAEAERIRADALNLALFYQFVTDLTAMVVVQKTAMKRKEDDGQKKGDIVQQADKAAAEWSDEEDQVIHVICSHQPPQQQRPQARRMTSHQRSTSTCSQRSVSESSSSSYSSSGRYSRSASPFNAEAARRRSSTSIHQIDGSSSHTQTSTMPTDEHLDLIVEPPSPTFIDQLVLLGIDQALINEAIANLPELAMAAPTVASDSDKRLFALLEQLILLLFPDTCYANKGGMVEQLFNAKNPVYVVKMDGERRWAVYHGAKVVGEYDSLVKAVQLLISIIKDHADECEWMPTENPLLLLLAVNSADKTSNFGRLAAELLAIINSISAAAAVEEKKDESAVKAETDTDSGGCCCS